MSEIDTLISVIVGAVIGFLSSIGFDRWKEGREEKELKDRIRGLDVLANREDRDVRIQVKSRENGRAWMLTKNAEQLVQQNLFYVFVNLRNLDAPEYFVIPSEIVAEYVTRTHKLFLQDGGSDSTLRKLPNAYGKDLELEKYKDRWDSLIV